MIYDMIRPQNQSVNHYVLRKPEIDTQIRLQERDLEVIEYYIGDHAFNLLFLYTFLSLI